MTETAFACLTSPLFECVRIPGRASLVRIIERVCEAHGVNSQAVRARRDLYVSNEILAVRRDILREARAAKFPFSQIGDWFGHRDGQTVIQWIEDLGVE